jgi:predicted transcriptional regulator
MPTLTAQVPEELLSQIDAVAEKLDRSRAWVIKHALKRYLEERELDDRRWKETMEAIEAAERGEVVPGEDVLAWLDTWGTPAERSEDPK